MKIKGVTINQRELNKEFSKIIKESLISSSQNKDKVNQDEPAIERGFTQSTGGLKNQFIERLNKILSSYNKALKIEIDEDLKIPVYKIIDLETKEIIKQIPLEDILKLKKAILEILKKEIRNLEELKGIFFEREA